jgi:hypothetical protein
MTSKKLLLAGLIAALGMAGTVQAATVTLTPSISGVLNKDFTPIDPALIVGDRTLAPRAEDYVLQVEVNMKIEGVPTGDDDSTGFSNTAFNVAAHDDGAVYLDASLGINAWTSDNSQFDSNGPAIGGNVNKWDINSDDGAANDLQGVILANITKAFGPAAYDIRRDLGESAGGEHAGTFFISMPGTAGSTAAAEILAAFGASTYDATGASSTAGNTAVGGVSESWSVQPIPEPSTLALLGLGSVLLAVARKRR